MDTTHQFVGGKAFTEDKILIFNIKACAANNATIQDITKYFKKFGKLVNVRMVEDNDQRMPPELLQALRSLLNDSSFIQMNTSKEYVIQYSNAKAAARALRKPVHRFKNQCFQVAACCSFEQPDAQKFIEQLSKHFESNSIEDNASNNNCNIQNNEAHILTLNDDCLEHICKFLTIPDQINFALSCQRFSAVLALLSKVQLKNFNTNIMKNLTLFQMRVYLQIVGPQIKTLTADLRELEVEFDSEKQLFPFLGTFLTNVEKLKVIENSSNTLCSLIENMHLLQELELVRANFGDELLISLEKLQNLKILNIIVNSNITGSAIQQLKSLEKLTIYDCPEVLPHFKNICKNLTNLNYLDIRSGTYNKALDTEDYEHIAKYLLQLRTLKISCKDGDYKCLAQLPNLNKLEIKLTDFNLQKTEEFFKNLAKHQANQLEELSMNSFNFNPEAATSVAKLKKLKLLKCNFLLDDEILEILSNLKELENVEFNETEEFTDDGILKLLENCLKLKRVCLWCSLTEKRDLVSKSRKLLEKQRDQGIRIGYVTFVFKKPYFEMSFESESEKYEFSDVLKVTDEVDEGEDFDSEYYDDQDHYDDYDSYDGYDSYGYEYDDSDDDVYNFFHCNDDNFFF